MDQSFLGEVVVLALYLRSYFLIDQTDMQAPAPVNDLAEEVSVLEFLENRTSSL